MKRCSIIVHSVTGNDFMIADYLKKSLINKGVDARLYRVNDPDLHILANNDDRILEFYEDIIALPVVSNEKLLKGDAVILGCPTYFTNVSAEMKTFLDGTLAYYEAKSLNGKLFGCFTCCEGGEDEARGCLNGLKYWAAANGMVEPEGAELFYSGKARPGIELEKKIEDYAELFAQVLNG